jgi:hypothetical protein
MVSQVSRRAFVPPELLSGPFTTATAIALGLTHAALQSAPWRRLFRDVWVHVDVPDTREVRLSAVRLILPDRATVCGLTAAWLHGVDVRRIDDLDIHVGFPPGTRVRRRAGLDVCQETLAESDVVIVDGLRVTSPLRTAFDCARWLRGAERVVVLDALTHSRLVSVDEIAAYIAGKRRLRNLRVAEKVLHLVDPLAESPMETRLRLLLIDAGLPRPTSQFNVFDDRGRFVGRLDLAFEKQKVAVEYDGAQHWEERRHDDRRRTRLRELGWVILVYSSSDYYGRRQEIVSEVARHLHATRR